MNLSISKENFVFHTLSEIKHYLKIEKYEKTFQSILLKCVEIMYDKETCDNLLQNYNMIQRQIYVFSKNRITLAITNS